MLTVTFNRLEKRRQAMLDMPQMIQTWKEVCCSEILVIVYWVLILDIERSWSWMEEVAKIGDAMLRMGRIFYVQRLSWSI